MLPRSYLRVAVYTGVIPCCCICANAATWFTCGLVAVIALPVVHFWHEHVLSLDVQT